MLRRQAFRYSESKWAHWLMLMVADRVNVVEGVVQDIRQGRVPNIAAEMGLRSELAHNRVGLIKKVAIAGAVVGLASFTVNMLGRRAAKARNKPLR